MTAVFQPLFNKFDDSVLGTIATGSANIISLISPLMAVCFSIYVMLVMTSYWRGSTDTPIVDFFMRMASWAIIITAGMNIGYYSTYVVPFFNGIGEDIAKALVGDHSTANALDTLLSAYIDAAVMVMSQVFDANGIAEALKALCVAIPIVLMLIFTGIPFLGISAAYIILAKFSLGLLLALGPMFIAAALFPASRKFFEKWVEQCLNYAFLTALFAAVAAIEVQYATSIIPKGDGYVMSIAQVWGLGAMGLVFIVVSLNLPALASALAGGVGISTMTGKMSTAASMAGKLANTFKGKGGGGGGGISPT